MGPLIPICSLASLMADGGVGAASMRSLVCSGALPRLALFKRDKLSLCRVIAAVVSRLVRCCKGLQVILCDEADI